MHWILAAVPVPNPSGGPDADQVTPGVWGFVVTFALAVAVVLLIVDMVRRIRRVTYRAEIRERLAQEGQSPAQEGEGSAQEGGGPAQKDRG